MFGKRARIIAGVIAAVAVLALLAGCSPTADKLSPEHVTQKFLEAVRADDREELKLYYSGDTYADLDVGFENMENASEKWTDFDFEILDCTEYDDWAQVGVKISAYEWGEAFEEVFWASLDTMMADVKAGTFDEDEYTKSFANALNKKAEEMTEKSCTRSVVFNLSRGFDGSWKVDALGSTQLDALSGGVVTAVENLRQKQ